jgi:hypothetical protein
MRWIRRVHMWLGVLFAPSILIFALSGLFQMYGLHDPARRPSALIVRMSQIHTRQTVSPPSASPTDVGRATTPEAVRSEIDCAAAPEAAPAARIYFTAMAIALVVSTLLGLYMAFRPRRDRIAFGVLLAAGVIVPAVLLAME